MIYVIGLGFVGLTTAVGLSHKSQKIVGVDSNSKIIKDLLKKKIHFHEPHLKYYLSNIYVIIFKLKL